MGRKNKWESLIKLDVQDISNEGNNFSSEDLEWTPIGDDNNRHIDLCAAIPFERLSHFVQGEGLLDDSETQFVIKKHKVYNLTEPNDHATKMYLSYHCAYGPEDRRNKPENNLEKMQRIRRFTQKRGCQAHFYVKVMYGRPNVAIITYNEFSHQDANGEFCHGKDDPSGDPRSSVAPRLSNECKSYIESLLLMGVSIDTICEQHYLDRGLTKLMNKRDTCLLRKDVLNAWKRVRSLRSQKNEDDAKSVCLWHEEEKDNFFYYKTPNNEENVPFIIGIQTPWMREMMVKHSHNSIIAMDSTFSTKKYGYQLYSLLAFDEQEAGVPVAWAISSRNKVEDINEWLMEVYKRGKQDKEDWHVNAFMTDDASAEIEAIRLSFDCQVLLCIWHVRRAWLKNVYRYVSNKDVATHIFDRLREIMYEISDDQGITTQSIKNFMEEFKEEKKFIDYFQNTWCHDESRIDDVTPLVDDIDEVRGNSSHEIDIIDGCIPSEDQDVHGVVIGEAQRIALEDHQKNQEYMVPNSVDPEKTTTTIVDAMQARDGFLSIPQSQPYETTKRNGTQAEGVNPESTGKRKIRTGRRVASGLRRHPFTGTFHAGGQTRTRRGTDRGSMAIQAVQIFPWIASALAMGPFKPHPIAPYFLAVISPCLLCVPAPSCRVPSPPSSESFPH
ncbi:hypothetical protein SUGI_0720590 [Cryptomeria japonica]|nr:hypothetical protein SUGI_0720590 [Cryptomeria japonica]